MPQCQNCPRGGSLEQHPTTTTQDHILVFWCLLFVTEDQMNPPPSSQDRPACRPCCHCRSIFFLYCFIFFFFVSRDVDVAGLVTVESREREPFSWAFFVVFFNVCLNYPAQSAYVLMLLLPCCIQWGHIDPQTTPNPSLKTPIHQKSTALPPPPMSLSPP